MKRDGAISASAFKDRGDSMSTDWSRYSTPEQTQARAKTPEQNGVVSLVAGDVRDVTLEVAHSPLESNRAHTDVIGPKDEEVRVRLRRLAKTEIPVAPLR